MVYTGQWKDTKVNRGKRQERRDAPRGSMQGGSYQGQQGQAHPYDGAIAPVLACSTT